MCLKDCAPANSVDGQASGFAMVTLFSVSTCLCVAVEGVLTGLRIPFILLQGDPVTTLPAFLADAGASLLVRHAAQCATPLRDRL